MTAPAQCQQVAYCCVAVPVAMLPQGFPGTDGSMVSMVVNQGHMGVHHPQQMEGFQMGHGCYPVMNPSASQMGIVTPMGQMQSMMGPSNPEADALEAAPAAPAAEVERANARKRLINQKKAWPIVSQPAMEAAIEPAPAQPQEVKTVKARKRLINQKKPTPAVQKSDSDSVPSASSRPPIPPDGLEEFPTLAESRLRGRMGGRDVCHPLTLPGQVYSSTIKALNLSPTAKEATAAKAPKRLQLAPLRGEVNQKPVSKVLGPSPVPVSPQSMNSAASSPKLLNIELDGGASDVMEEPVIEAAVCEQDVNVVFSRDAMLRIYRQMHSARALRFAPPGARWTLRTEDASRSTDPTVPKEACDRAIFGTRKKTRGGPKEELHLPPLSENAWKKEAPVDRKEELQRNVRSFLGKIGHMLDSELEDFVEPLASNRPDTVEELKAVASTMFEVVLRGPSYCKIYLDVIVSLQGMFPEFTELEQPVTLADDLRRRCMEEFDAMPTSFDASSEELQMKLNREKGLMKANMIFMGHLFLRQLLDLKAVEQVVHDLLSASVDVLAKAEHKIEFACELLKAIGDGTRGKKKLLRWFKVLKDLQQAEDLSKRIRTVIVDLLDLKKNNWPQPLETIPKAPKKEEDKVVKMYQYFRDDKDGSLLEEDWKNAKFSTDDSKEAIVKLVKLVFKQEKVKEREAVALLLAELIARQLVSCDALQEVLQLLIAPLETWRKEELREDIFGRTLLRRVRSAQWP
ncbi:unnamed protein product [Durusdinium trenchii]|uniref:MIF4G domain-containing protein n=2 Tax=Durusdinium trenchii TaxID=1381693 RepID=A0ABP0MR44_9DINO